MQKISKKNDYIRADCPREVNLYPRTVTSTIFSYALMPSFGITSRQKADKYDMTEEVIRITESD